MIEEHSFMPRQEMAEAYNVTPFRTSVLPDSVSAHFLCHTLRFSNGVWYMGLSREHTGLIRIWSWLNNFRQSFSPCT